MRRRTETFQKDGESCIYKSFKAQKMEKFKTSANQAVKHFNYMQCIITYGAIYFVEGRICTYLKFF